jgi:hypothetical protein
MPRLETISPSLAAAFQRASDQKRRRTTLLACEVAVALSGLHGKAVDRALKLVRDGSQEPDVSREIAALSDRLDDEY